MNSEHKDPKHTRFKTGDIILLKPGNEFFDKWVARYTKGPFLVLDAGGKAGGWDDGQMQRLSDGEIFTCGVVTSWWAVLDPFLDAARKANHGTL